MSVRLRLRKTRSKGYSAYFDLYRKGQRQCEATEIYLTADYQHPLRDETGQALRDSKGQLRYPKPSEQDKLKLELLEKIRLQRELQLKNEEYGFTDSRVKRINLLDYIAQIYEDTKSAHYGNLIPHLKKSLGTMLPFCQVDEKMVKKFLTYLEEEAKLGSNSRCTYFATLSAVFNYAVRDKIITQNPCKLLARQDKPKAEESQRTFLTMEELALLAAAPVPSKKQHQVKEGFLFSCLTGLRISDVLKIKYSDIKEGVLQYRQQKSKAQFHYLPLSGQAQELITSLQADPRGEFLFWDLNRKITHSQRLHILDEWVKSAGIKRRITFHVGRHTYATLLLTFGQDIYTVSKLLGHSSVSMTERYGKIINPKKTEAVNKIPRILHKGETGKQENKNGTAEKWDRLGMEEFDAMLREVFCEKIPELA